MTLDEAIKAFEARFAKVESFVQTNDSIAPNGKRFDVFAPGMTFNKGRPVVKGFEEAAEAIDAWLAGAEFLANEALGERPKGAPPRGVLYWRINPHITKAQGGVTVVCSMAFGEEVKANEAQEAEVQNPA